MRLACVCHLFHLDLWPEIAIGLSYLPDFDLYVTIPLEQYNAGDARTLERLYPKVKWRFFENRGRDVLPFCSVYNSDIRDRYDAVVKIHTKKSPHARGFGELWRKALYDTLLNHSDKCLKILQQPGCAIVTDWRFALYYPPKGRNIIAVAALAGRVGWQTVMGRYAAGTMFWARTGVFDEIAEYATRFQWEP